MFKVTHTSYYSVDGVDFKRCEITNTDTGETFDVVCGVNEDPIAIYLEANQ